MIIDYTDTQYTPNQIAKIMVAQYGESADYWHEKDCVLMDRLTDREEAEISKAVERQSYRVRKFLNLKGSDYV